MSITLDAAVTDAYRVLETGEPLDRETAYRLAELPGESVLDLLSLANKTRLRYAVGGASIHTCSIMNVKSGSCGENCRFCAQSRHNSTVIEVYDLASQENVLCRAQEAFAQGVSHFGIVTSGYGYLKITPEFQRILSLIDRLHRELPELKICGSFGVLGEESAEALARRALAHYNINIQVVPARYSDLIADTHVVDERIATVKLLRRHGVSVCCGGIIGVGESMRERIDMIYTLSNLDVSVIPLNVLVPVDGTPLERSGGADLADIAKTFAICRLVHPRKIIKFAAGRETVMKDFQGLLMLAGASGFLTGGYLTTRGREIPDDREFSARLAAFNGEVDGHEV